MRNKKTKSIFAGIRKPIARPTQLMQSKRQELIMESVEKDEFVEIICFDCLQSLEDLSYSILVKNKVEHLCKECFEQNDYN